MIINFNDWGELTIDLDSLHIWISAGDSSDQHTCTGARVEIDHENVYIKLTPENAQRLNGALLAAMFKKQVDPIDCEHEVAGFVGPDTWED